MGLHLLDLTAVAREGLRACAWLAIVVFVFVPLERLFHVRRARVLGATPGGDIVFFFLNNFVPPLLLLAPLAAAAWLGYRLVPPAFHAWIETWPLWLRAAAAFVVADLGFYWGHRWMHRVPFLWRFHAVHHAPQHLYFLISARAHPIDNAIIRVCGLIPITVLGLGAPASVQGSLVATLVMLVLTLWGFFIHANVRWRFGPLEWLLATPAFHHWHHVRDAPRDRNFASMLPLWDRLFGTHHAAPQFPPAYGLTAPLRPSVAGQLIAPLLPAAAPAPAGARG